MCVSACDEKMYGVNCTEKCGSCLKLEQCNHINGTCMKGCDMGFHGSDCIEGNWFYSHQNMILLFASWYLRFLY